MNGELLTFTEKALSAGMERQKIADVLSRAGWADYDVKAALNAFADVASPIAVPRPKPYLSAREVFTYLILFAALYAVAYFFGALLFAMINWHFPDPLITYDDLRSEIRWDISFLIVALPVFAFAFYRVTKATANDPTKRASRPRKWLTYLTLFGAAIVIMIDLSVLLYGFLGGELTVRFFLKVATVIIIAGGIFGYFLNDLREEENE